MPKSKLKDKLFTSMHDDPMVGHLGFLKTYRQVDERFSWNGFKEDVFIHVRECATYQENMVENTFLANLLQPLPIANQKWESISIHFSMGLLKVHGKDCINVIVDRLTKYACFYGISINYTTI